MTVWNPDRNTGGEQPEAGGLSPAILPERSPEIEWPRADRSASPLGGVQVVLDPGPAGGRPEGARWLLSVARSAAGRLRDLGARVSLTQEGDGSVPHPVRRLRARRADADLVLGLDVAGVGADGGGLGGEGRGVRLRYAPWRPWRTGPGRWAAQRLTSELAAAGAVDAGVAAGLAGDGCRGVAGVPRSVSLLAVFGERWPGAADGEALAAAIARGVGAVFGDVRDWHPARAGIRAPGPRDPQPSPQRGPGSAPVDPRTDPGAGQPVRRPSAATPPERGGTHVEGIPLPPSWPEDTDAGDAAWPPAAVRASLLWAAAPAPEAGGASMTAPESAAPEPWRPEGLPWAPADRQTAYDPVPVPPERAAGDPTYGQWQDALDPVSGRPKAEEGLRVRGPGGPGRVAEMEPASYMYDYHRYPARSLRHRLAAGGFTLIDRQRTVDDWYRPLLGPTAFHVHFPAASSPSGTSADAVTVRRLPPPPPPAGRASATPVRVTRSR